MITNFLSSSFSSFKKYFKAKNEVKYNDLKKKLKTLRKNYSKLSAQQIYMISNTIDFDNKIAADILVNRCDICAAEINLDIKKLYQIIKDTYHTRIIVYEGDIDRIKGYLHIKDVLINIINKKFDFKIKDILRQHIISTHSAKLTNLLIEMQSNSTHIAVILDEYGCTDGIITFEDLMEELVGEIDDEHDSKTTENNYYFLNNNSIMINAKTKISVVEKLLNLSLKTSEDNYDSLGGFIINKLGRLPKKGEMIEISDNINAQIIDATLKTIKKIHITISNDRDFK